MMIKPLLTLLSVSVLCGPVLGLPSAQAADIKVTWTNPDKYRDIHSGRDGKKRFRESTFRELEMHLSKLAKALPESQILDIEISDLDLAGDVHGGGIRDRRVKKDIYFPRIKFSFKLINPEQAIIHSGNVNLKGMNFMMGGRLRYKNKTLGYEKQLLDEWFKGSFSGYVKK
jgi:hypothetical protein